MMEVFAGFLTHTDHHIGRLLDFLKQIGEFDNTLIMVLSDNGASSEGGPTGSVNENLFFNNVPESLEDNLKGIDQLGGPTSYNHYAWGWTWAGNTPFRRWKRETYRGGTSDPFIVHWPKGLKAKGEVRTQYAHAIDMVPTVLELLELDPPTSIRGVTQSPIEGHSFAHALHNAKATSKHVTQYFEMMGHRSLYHDGWRAVCPWPGPSFAEAGEIGCELDIFDEARANGRLYNYLPKMRRGVVNAVIFSPMNKLTFEPDLLIFLATVSQAEIVLRAMDYLSGGLRESKTTGVFGCSWLFTYPFQTGKINYTVTGLAFGMKAKKVFPEGQILFSIPYDRIPILIRNMNDMIFELPSYQESVEAFKKRESRIIRKLSEEAEATGQED